MKSSAATLSCKMLVPKFDEAR